MGIIEPYPLQNTQFRKTKQLKRARKVTHSLTCYFVLHLYCRRLLNCSTRLGRAMAQAVRRPPLTAEPRVRSPLSPCGIFGGQSGTGTGFSPPSISVFPCQFHSTGAPLQGKTKKLIIFITGLHNKPQGCGESIASAVGPFKKNTSFMRGGIIHY